MLDLKVMAKVQFRHYREEDLEEVKEVFTVGMSEHIPSSCMHVLKQPLAQMILGCVFCALLTSSKSILLPVLAITLLLAGGRQAVSFMFTKYIQTSLDQDLNHIQQTYMDPPKACFWVAESQGRVVSVRVKWVGIRMKYLRVNRSNRRVDGGECGWGCDQKGSR